MHELGSGKGENSKTPQSFEQYPKPEGFVDGGIVKENTSLKAAVEHMFPGFNYEDIPSFTSLVPPIDTGFASARHQTKRFKLDELFNQCEKYQSGLVVRTEIGPKAPSWNQLAILEQLKGCAPIKMPINPNQAVFMDEPLGDVIAIEKGETLGGAVRVYHRHEEPKLTIPLGQGVIEVGKTPMGPFKPTYYKFGVMDSSGIPTAIISFYPGKDFPGNHVQRLSKETKIKRQPTEAKGIPKVISFPAPSET